MPMLNEQEYISVFDDVKNIASKNWTVSSNMEYSVENRQSNYISGYAYSPTSSPSFQSSSQSFSFSGGQMLGSGRFAPL